MDKPVEHGLPEDLAAGLTDEQRAALVQSVARGRAQYQAGEAISGAEVSRWVLSWGTADELPPPRVKPREN